MDDLFGVTEIAKQILDEEAGHHTTEIAEKDATRAEESAVPDVAEHAERKE
jgi:hypothetical protein